MIDGLLKKQISASNANIVLLRKQALKIEEQIKEEKALIAEASICLQDICKHIETHPMSNYTPGGHDYKSETIRTLNCSNCKKVLDSTTEYGSFQ